MSEDFFGLRPWFCAGVNMKWNFEWKKSVFGQAQTINADGFVKYHIANG